MQSPSPSTPRLRVFINYLDWLFLPNPLSLSHLLSLSVAVVFIWNKISFTCFSLLSVVALSLYSYWFNFIFEYVEYYISKVKQYKRHDQKCITASCIPSTQFPQPLVDKRFHCFLVHASRVPFCNNKPRVLKFYLYFYMKINTLNTFFCILLFSVIIFPGNHPVSA